MLYQNSIDLTAPLSAVVLYENLETCRRAQQAFQKLARQPQGCANWNTNYWILNLVELPTIQKLVALDIGRSDVVVLVLEDESELPATVLNCLQTNLAEATQPKALVALLSFCTLLKRDVSPVKLQLENLAEKTHKAFYILRTDLCQSIWSEPEYEPDELMRALVTCTGWMVTNASVVIPAITISTIL